MIRRVAVVSGAAALVIQACGGDGDSTTVAPEHTTTPAFANTMYMI